MTKYEVYIAGVGNTGNFELEKVIEAKNINEAFDIAYSDNSHRWRYLKKIKEKKKDDQ